MSISTGIPTLDQRLGTLRAGGVYILTGEPGAGKLTALLQFLHAGLMAGERVALLGADAPGAIIEGGRHFGFSLDAPWRDGRLVLLGYQGGFARRVQHAADTADVLAELTGVLGNGVTRLGIHQAGVFWEGRAATSAGRQFLEWAEGARLTVLATLTRDLGESLSASTTSVLEGAAGVFELESLPDGTRNLWVRRFVPPIDLPGPVSLTLSPGKGLVPPADRPTRRRTDLPPVDPRAMLFVQLAAKVPTDLMTWGRQRFQVEEIVEPLALVPRLQDKPSFGVILVYLDRANAGRAVLACQAARQMTAAAIILASDEPLRAADRVRALEAGADDFLAGGLDFAELEARIGRAVHAASSRVRPDARTASARSAAPRGSADELDHAEFAARLRARLDGGGTSVFSVIRFSQGAAAKNGGLRRVALQQLRWEEGDFLGAQNDSFAIFLQNARPAQAESFLARLQRALTAAGVKTARLEYEVLSSPGDATRLSQILDA